MIIDGHPDILLGPRGLNGLHGFGSTPQPVQSDAFTRFLPENGGLGIDALYQEIRDFINTPGRTQAEIDQAAAASGVSYFDINKAFAQVNTNAYVPNPADVQPVQSDAFTRFLPENGGMGIQALYQEIRDFINTPGRTQAEIDQAAAASGVSYFDINEAMSKASANVYVPNPADVQPVTTFPVVDDYTFTLEPDFVITPLSAAYLRFLPENGGQGLEQLYKEIRDFIATNPTQAELEQAMRASGVEQGDIDNAFAQQPPDDYTFEQLCPPGSKLVNGVCVGDPATYGPGISDITRKNYEIVDYVMTHSDAEILAQMAISNVSQSDIIQAFKEFDAGAGGQSPAFTRYLPENGGLGLDALYKEINDYASTHSLYELLAQMQRSGVSMKDVDAANSYAFGKQQAQTPAEYAAAQAEQEAAAQAIIAAQAAQAQQAVMAAQAAAIRAAQEAASARAAAAAAATQAAARAAQEVAEARAAAATQAALAAQAAQAQQAVQAALAAQQAAAAAAAAQAAATQAAAAIATAQATATAVAAVVATTVIQSEAYTRFLPENGGQGLDVLYQEIRDYVATHTDAEIKQTAAASGVSNVDIVVAFNQTQQATAAAVVADAAAATAAATSAATSAATAAAVAVAKEPEPSEAYTRFLPENGGKGIPALYKEISDFVDTHSNAEIQTAMIASGVSEVDVVKALQVFPNKVVTQPAKETGLALPLVVSAIAAFFVLG